METTIVENTKKQRLDQIEKHKDVLTHIESLKQFLKSEVANRKETELHFEWIIEKKTGQIADQFNVTYLNNLYEMRDRLKQFEERQNKIDAKAHDVQEFITKELDSHKEDLLKKIETSK